MFENFLQQPKVSRDRIQAQKARILAELEAKNNGLDNKLEKIGAKEVSRRNFLKIFGAAVGIGIGSVILKKTEVLQNITKPAEQKQEIEEDLDEEIYYDGEEPDIEAIKNIFNFNAKGKIEINLEISDQLKEYWKHKYANKMKNDLVGAFEDMKPFLPELRSIFQKHGVPEEYALLAIPESHWKPEAVSRSGAEGPYQFMPKTGKMFGLETSTDRRDPLKSADACARLLKDLYNRTQDWELSLSGYNGGFIWEYLSGCKRKKQQPAYENFLKFLTEKANHIKNEVREKLSMKHTVAKGDTLMSLSKKYNMKVEVINKHNKLKNNKIRIGQVLKIPISNEEKSELFQKKIQGIAENLNYPPKFIAVFELVQNTVAWQKGKSNSEKA